MHNLQSTVTLTATLGSGALYQMNPTIKVDVALLFLPFFAVTQLMTCPKRCNLLTFLPPPHTPLHDC